MTTTGQLTRAKLENQAFALMSRMHVLLRRGQGRVTDIDYMRIDPAYCRHVLELAGATGDEDLRQIGARLQEIYFGEAGLFVATLKTPLLARAPSAQVTPAAAPVEASMPAPAALSARAATVRSYVGRLR
ncbi:hypothetical protein LXA47_14760 [Massilia sp. P8910]|uniref:hypothetical protein n=1 Tax=Massilia antarctica TaxID=2765360 RepID=UPI0006BB6E66|nr:MULTISPECIES: hypothetical protein [Massilia]MCE3604864.1 hypothetical protein [Massilia antarctica]MCY0914695.1 hypothetical protein [Massilia sp. H27-R4]CUI08276.1 hypothetical protein BN2497_11329 [Janthinobacterium sp. CG23_2]CUU32062.1 hypothetical protein BN3177_11329 [Janthinobacterium sp. CG23_2]